MKSKAKQSSSKTHAQVATGDSAKTRAQVAAGGSAKTHAQVAAGDSAKTRADAKAANTAKPVVLDGTKLTQAEVLDVALRARPVSIAAPALRKVQQAAQFLASELARGEPLYGVTTGFGSNADRLLANKRLRASDSELDLVEELQHHLIISHAVCVGPALPESIVRAMLVIRLNTLLSGHSGIRAIVLKLMAELLNAGITPIVPELGSVGASGDLAPLSHLALPLLGLGDVHYQGSQISAALALQQCGLAPVKLSCKEGLALNNGTTQMLATAVLTLDRMQAALFHADLLAALSLEAFCGRSDAFDERAHKLRPHPGQLASAHNIRKLTKSSGLVDIAYHRVPRFHPWSERAWDASDAERTFDIRWDYVRPSERVGRESFYQRYQPFRGGKKFQPQDAYSLRCTPQVHGAVKDTYNHVCQVINIELNAVTDNPIIFPAEVVGGSAYNVTRVLSAGNFHGMPLALALAQLKCAIPVLASISERRLNKLLDPATNDGLPPFLIGNEDGTDSGLMIVQYTAAAIVNDLATRAHPACVYSVPTSANAEDHVSMGTNDARHAWSMVQDLARVQAIELQCATQALDYRLQILTAARKLATDVGVHGVRSKIRLPAELSSADAEALNADVKRLQADLSKLTKVNPSPVTTGVLQHVRKRGLSFIARDRLLSHDMLLAQELIESGELLALVKQLGIKLILS